MFATPTHWNRGIRLSFAMACTAAVFLLGMRLGEIRQRTASARIASPASAPASASATAATTPTVAAPIDERTLIARELRAEFHLPPDAPVKIDGVWISP